VSSKHKCHYFNRETSSVSTALPPNRGLWWLDGVSGVNEVLRSIWKLNY
jgi:hypothetical protein